MGGRTELAIVVCGFRDLRQHTMPGDVAEYPSPGILLAKLPPAFGGQAPNIGTFVVVTFIADAAYYTVILWFLFMAFRVFFGCLTQCILAVSPRGSRQTCLGHIPVTPFRRTWHLCANVPAHPVSFQVNRMPPYLILEVCSTWAFEAKISPKPRGK